MFSNHELEDVGMVFSHHFCKLGIPSLNMVVCSFVSFCVDIPHVLGASPSHVSTKYTVLFLNIT